MHPYRTHTCGELRNDHIDRRVRLSGWIHNRRDHGGVLFIDLRDHYGITQVVIYPDRAFQYEVGHLPKETTVRFDGVVVHRSENVNPKLPTGEIEVIVDDFEVLGPAEHVPFTVFQEEEVAEDLRLKHRYLDLRRPTVHQNIVLRSQIIASMRRRMREHGFLEFQTPILTSSSPEGARDYLVPSRVHPGRFYALPQAPQQFKQLLMISGFDRYFQIAPCFRDEDARADRSPGEFYQLDIEMAFATQEDVFEVVEDVLHGVFAEFSDKQCDALPFRRIPYREAMLHYGTDKPDLRIPLTMTDVSELFAKAGFKAFSEVIKKGGVVRALPVPSIADRPRSFFDRLVEYAQSIGSKGLAYLVWTDDKVKGPIAKFLDEERLGELAKACEVKSGDVVFFVAASETEAARIGGDLRVKIANDVGLVEENAFRFCWVVDFPMFEWDEERKCISFSHNPFSMPQGGMEALETKDPLEIHAFQYDIVCNGIELSSGAIRNHRTDVMYKAFEIAGYDKSVVDEKFGALSAAFKYGAPPHGGIAPGVDRIVMLLAGTTNIREVIAFPMNQRAQDLMMNAPGRANEEQLRELHIRLSASAREQEQGE
ncbi:MAG: aspartate--tRNA ligase [Chitinivibrionales bacterium]|nr:aspartate--tRNA ligase [Chitinivibrionales bacterium]MBD3356663.1 aspartate--tRNA ligase [Chitinivibrionales bacterium]